MKLNNALISKVAKGFNMKMKYKRLLHETFILLRAWLIKLNPVLSIFSCFSSLRAFETTQKFNSFDFGIYYHFTIKS